MKYVVFYMCRTIKILISNWPRKLKFIQFLQEGKTCQLLFDVGHALRRIFILWLVKIWQVSSCGKFMQHLKSCLRWPSFVSACDVFNCLFPLNVQSEIQLLSRVFCYSWLVCLLGFWLRNTSLWQSRKSDFGWHRFRFSPCLIRKTVESDSGLTW